MAKVSGGGGTAKKSSGGPKKVMKNLSPAAQRNKIMAGQGKKTPTKSGGGSTGFKPPSKSDAAKGRKALGKYSPRK